MTRIVASAALFFAFAAAVPVFLAETAAPRFTESAAKSGLNFRLRNSATPRKYLIETMGGGLAIFDSDNDGWPDVFFVNGAALNNPQSDRQAPDKSAPEFWNRLFHNNHDGTFTDVTEKAGLKGRGYGMGAATGDYDNDGYTDLLVTNYGGIVLYRNNGDGSFSDVTAKSRLEADGWTTGAGFFDYDADGCLDLVVARYLDWDFARGEMFCGVNAPGGRSYCHPDEFPTVSNYLFRNNCDGTFRNVSESSGIAAVKGKALGLAFGDFDNDGRIDVYIANDAAPQMLFRNNGNGTFTDVATAAGVAYTEDGKTFSGMGTVFTDIDNDGLPDILTTALPYEYYALFHNAGKGQFQYASVTSGLAKASRPYGGWGIRAFDYDNDGNKELFVANAHVMDNIEVTQPHLRSIQPPLLLGYKGGKFVDISGSAGDAFKQPWAARGAAFGDLDNDGDIDVIVTDYNAPAHLLRNDGGNRNHWIALNLRGTKSNRSAIGAKVRLTSNSGTVQHAMVSTAGSYLSANDSRLFFGLGQEREIREIYIKWPSGLEQTITGAKSDEFLTIVEAEQRRIQPATPAPANSASAQQTLDTGLALVKQGKTAEARAAFRDALKLDPDLTEAHFALGVLLARQGKQNYGEAMDHFLQVIRRNPSDVDAHVNLSNLLEEGGDLGAAIAEMNKAVSLAPDNAQLYVMLGQKQQKLRDYEGAANSFRRALDSGRQLPQAFYGLGMTLKASRNWEEAARQFQAALALNPADAHAHWQLGVVRAEQQQFADAAAHLEESVRLNPQLADAWFELGKVCRRQGRTSDAETAFRKGLELKPDRVDALYALAKISKDADESSKLQGSIRELKAQSAESARAVGLNGEGVGLMDRGDIDGALAKFREALNVDPSFSVAAYNTGVALAHKGDTRGALDALRNAINLQPGFGAAHFALGILLKASGDPKADEELRTAKMLNELAANAKEKAGPR